MDIVLRSTLIALKGYILFTVGKDNQKLGYQIRQNNQLIDPMLFLNNG